jgi:hypothetical protein
MMGKSTFKVAPETRDSTSHFSEAGIGQTAFEGRIWRILQKGGQFPKSSIKQAISSALTNRKGTVKMGPKNRGKNAAQKSPKTESKIRPKRTRNRGLNEVVDEVLNSVHWSGNDWATMGRLGDSAGNLAGNFGPKNGAKNCQKTRQYSPHWNKAGFAEKQRMTPKLHRAT